MSDRPKQGQSLLDTPRICVSETLARNTHGHGPPKEATARHPSIAANPPARPELSTWSTRSAASMNDVDSDQRRHTITERGIPIPKLESTTHYQSCVTPYRLDSAKAKGGAT
jgi:hypothetical protein